MRRSILLVMLIVGCRTSPPHAASPAPVAPVPGPPANIEPSLPSGPRLRVIALNDFHGALESRPDATGALRGGAASVAAAIKAAQAGCILPECATILLDAGDEFQGTPASNFSFGRPVTEVFNYLGVAASAVGNHEFDWTQDTLKSIMARSAYPMLSANTRYADGSDVPWIPNDTIIRRGPIAVGIIGITTVETPTTTLPENVADLRFVDPVRVIDSIAPTLRARGAQVVLVVAHAGGSCTSTGCHGEIFDIAGAIDAKVDAIIAGHSHTFINSLTRGMPIVEARSRGQAIEVLDILVGPPAVVTLHEVREVYTDSLPQNPDVQDMVRRATERVAPVVNREITTIAESMRISGRQYALGNLIADAMRVVGRGNIGIMNNGGIRQSLQAGVATYGALFEIQPFGNALVRVRVRGYDLRAFLERQLRSGIPDFHISGARVVFHTEPTSGVDSVTVGGRPLDPAAIYTVVENSFNASGGDNLGFGAAAISTEPSGIVDLDALVTYLQSLPAPVKAPSEQRLILRQ